MFEHFVIDTITIIILQADKFLKCDSLRPVIIKPNLKYLHVKITLPCSINRRQHGFFKTPQISLAAAAARDILVNFEISLAVFIPNTPRNRAISYTNCVNDQIFKQPIKIKHCMPLANKL